MIGGAWLALESLGLALGCDGTTTGDLVSLGTRVRADLAPGEAFETDLGATVSVSRAALSVASIVYLEGAPIARRLGEWLVPSARAHPGHYDAGLVVGEMTDPAVVQLGVEPTDLGVHDGVTGEARSASVLMGPSGRLAGVIEVEGTVEQAGRSFTFEATLTADDLRSTSTDLPEIVGCPVEGGQVEGDGTFVLEVALRLWLDQVDFGDASLADVSDHAVLEPGSVPHNGLVRGARKAAGYAFSFTPS